MLPTPVATGIPRAPTIARPDIRTDVIIDPATRPPHLSSALAAGFDSNARLVWIIHSAAEQACR